MFLRIIGITVLISMTANVRADDIVIGSFEADSFGDWKAEGEAFGERPTTGSLQGQMHVSKFAGNKLANSFHNGDAAKGTLTSPEFVLNRDFLSFLIGGGNRPGEVGVELLIDGKQVRDATGTESEELHLQSWDIRDLKGKSARMRAFDRVDGGWGHILIDQVVLTDALAQSSTSLRLENYRKSPAYYRERYRPQYHFTPEINWMNDPNGLVYFDGEYHLFYQHNPHGNEWGHMSWGHAVSQDLLHWKHLPIALHEEYGVMAFSGSAVVDHSNTSGLGVLDQPPLVAIYTGHTETRQTQDLAFSRDRGRTWTKFEGNPVLDLREKDFRDPKVFWHEPTKRWVMIVSLAAQKKLQIYVSDDLKAWKLSSEFGPAGVSDKPNWECPDLFELPIDGEPGQTRWVLQVSIGGGSVAGGSGGEYFTGIFDGKRFTPDSERSQWVDHGRDFYAPVSYSDIPASDGRRIWVGWMNNWETCLNPTTPWRSAMSIPRELTLRRIENKLRLCQHPVRELTSLRSGGKKIVNRILTNESLPIEVTGQQLEILLEVQVDTATEFGVRVLKGKDEETVAGYSTKSKSMFVDRTRSGDVGFHPRFTGHHSAPLAMNDQRTIRLQIFVDTSSVEVFGNDGEAVVTDLVFPKPDSNHVELFASGGTCRVVSCQVHSMKSVWATGVER